MVSVLQLFIFYFYFCCCLLETDLKFLPTSLFLQLLGASSPGGDPPPSRAAPPTICFAEEGGSPLTLQPGPVPDLTRGPL